MPHYHAYYEAYTGEQLAADEYFQQWVLAEDRLNNLFWNTYIERYPGKLDELVEARRLVKDLAVNPYPINLSVQEKLALKISIYQELGLEQPQQSGSGWISRNRNFLFAAAALIGGLIVAAYSLITREAGKESFITEYSGSKEIRELMLPDSSMVVLNANSSLKFKSHFLDDSLRTVLLQGNAYFKVRKLHDLKPFIVQANQLNIRVTGTEFNVNARTLATDIVLTSGKVNVSLKDQRNTPAYMTEGERLRFDTVKQELQYSKANTDLYTTAWKKKEWHFQDTPLDSIAELIREYYGVQTVFSNTKQAKMMITAIVSVNDFNTLVNVIAKTLNIRIKEENSQLLIY